MISCKRQRTDALSDEQWRRFPMLTACATPQISQSAGMVDPPNVEQIEAGAHPFNPHPPAEPLLGLGAGMEPPSPSIVTPQDQPTLLPEQQPRLVML